MKLTKQIRTTLVELALCLLVVAAAGVAGYYACYSKVFHSLATRGESVYPPAPFVASSQEVLSFVRKDATNLLEYGEGRNCIEFAILLERQARWAGLTAQAFSIELESGTYHVVLGFPTTDKGWMFVEPITDDVIYPLADNATWYGEKIVGVSELIWSWEDVTGSNPNRTGGK